MKMIGRRIAAACALLGLGLAAGPALAFEAPAIPEPGVLSLLGVGGAVALVIILRNRRK